MIMADSTNPRWFQTVSRVVVSLKCHNCCQVAKCHSIAVSEIKLLVCALAGCTSHKTVHPEIFSMHPPNIKQ